MTPVPPEPPTAAAGVAPATPALQITDLVKRYGSRTALDGPSFALGRGQFVALLGPNGAGKSTLFQVLTGLFVPDGGSAHIAGIDLRRDAVAALARLGVVFQQMSLDLDLSVRRNLVFQAQLQGLAGPVGRERIARQAEALGLTADLDRPVRELSGGNRRKVELVRALLGEPDVLLMDEATVGLDPKSRLEVRAAIDREIAARGTSVLWATHLVGEAEAADRVLVLHRGRLLADGTPAQVCAALGGGSLEEAFIRATADAARAAA